MNPPEMPAWMVAAVVHAEPGTAVRVEGIGRTVHLFLNGEQVDPPPPSPGEPRTTGDQT